MPSNLNPFVIPLAFRLDFPAKLHPPKDNKERGLGEKEENSKLTEWLDNKKQNS